MPMKPMPTMPMPTMLESLDLWPLRYHQVLVAHGSRSFCDVRPKLLCPYLLRIQPGRQGYQCPGRERKRPVPGEVRLAGHSVHDNSDTERVFRIRGRCRHASGKLSCATVG